MNGKERREQIIKLNAEIKDLGAKQRELFDRIIELEKEHIEILDKDNKKHEIPIGCIKHVVFGSKDIWVVRTNGDRCYVNEKEAKKILKAMGW